MRRHLKPRGGPEREALPTSKRESRRFGDRDNCDKYNCDVRVSLRFLKFIALCALRRNAGFTYESQHDDFGQGFCADAHGNDTSRKCPRQPGPLVLIEVSRDTVKTRLVRHYKSS